MKGDRKVIEDGHEVMHALSRAIMHDMHKRAQPILDRYELTRMQMPYLKLLIDNGRTTLRWLSDSLNVDKANTTRAINGLREKGLVADDRENENSRKYNIFLTPKGMELAGELKEVLDGVKEQYLEGISDEEIEFMVDVVRRIKKNVEQ